MLTHNIHYCQSELIILDILWMLFYNVLNVFGWIIIIFCYSSYNSQTQLQSNLSSEFYISLDLNEFHRLSSDTCLTFIVILWVTSGSCLLHICFMSGWFFCLSLVCLLDCLTCLLASLCLCPNALNMCFPYVYVAFWPLFSFQEKGCIYSTYFFKCHNKTKTSSL